MSCDIIWHHGVTWHWNRDTLMSHDTDVTTTLHERRPRIWCETSPIMAVAINISAKIAEWSKTVRWMLEGVGPTLPNSWPWWREGRAGAWCTTWRRAAPGLPGGTWQTSGIGRGPRGTRARQPPSSSRGALESVGLCLVTMAFAFWPIQLALSRAQQSLAARKDAQNTPNTILHNTVMVHSKFLIFLKHLRLEHTEPEATKVD